MQAQTVDSLKAAGHYFAAGALAHALGMDNNYGCHFGLTSSRAFAVSDFQKGWKGAADSRAHLTPR